MRQLGLVLCYDGFSWKQRRLAIRGIARPLVVEKLGLVGGGFVRQSGRIRGNLNVVVTSPDTRTCQSPSPSPLVIAELSDLMPQMLI